MLCSIGDVLCVLEVCFCWHTFFIVGCAVLVPHMRVDFSWLRHIVGDVESDCSCHYAVVVFAFCCVSFSVIVTLVDSIFVQCFLFAFCVEVFFDDACKVVYDEWFSSSIGMESPFSSRFTFSD